MKVYRVMRQDGAWVLGDAHGKPYRANDGQVSWTWFEEDAATWTKEGGAESWLEWYQALGEPQGKAYMDHFEDPTRTVGDDG